MTFLPLVPTKPVDDACVEMDADVVKKGKAGAANAHRPEDEAVDHHEAKVRDVRAAHGPRHDADKQPRRIRGDDFDGQKVLCRAQIIVSRADFGHKAGDDVGEQHAGLESA